MNGFATVLPAISTIYKVCRVTLCHGSLTNLRAKAFLLLTMCAIFLPKVKQNKTNSITKTFVPYSALGCTFNSNWLVWWVATWSPVGATGLKPTSGRSEERRVGKECRCRRMQG